MQTLPARLLPGNDLRAAVEDLARTHFPDGAFVVCGIGSIVNPRLRLADQTEAAHYIGAYELLTLSGTVTARGAHLHMSMAPASGQVIGGHVVYGNAVRTTVELLLAKPGKWYLSRAHDQTTGFQELVVGQPPGPRYLER